MHQDLLWLRPKMSTRLPVGSIHQLQRELHDPRRLPCAETTPNCGSRKPCSGVANCGVLVRLNTSVRNCSASFSVMLVFLWTEKSSLMHARRRAAPKSAAHVSESERRRVGKDGAVDPPLRPGIGHRRILSVPVGPLASALRKRVVHSAADTQRNAAEARKSAAQLPTTPAPCPRRRAAYFPGSS